MKYDDLFSAYTLQADLRTAVSNLRKFRSLFFTDAAKKHWATPLNKEGKLPVPTLMVMGGPQAMGDIVLDPDDVVFQEIEIRLQVRVRELAEKLRRLGVEVPEAVLS